ncbi:MAG: GTP 3',8-cyclase MoaA [Planctomycetota bacterium]
MPPPTDLHRRPLRSLRLSVTDRCNLRCAYCMPEEDYTWLPKPDILDFGEVERLVRVFVGLGVDRLRLTGGEPLLRRDLPVLVGALARVEGVRDLALTTNGILLADQARDLRAAGLHRLTVSLDTLDRERFLRLARRDELARTLRGIEAAAEAGFTGTKLDTVVIRGTNEDEVPALLGWALERGLEPRFIEYMDVGGATRWHPTLVVSREEILARVAAVHGPAEPVVEPGSSAPAERFRLADGRVFGIIASTTQPFCASCDRSRLTADGHWFLCLYARTGLDLRAPLREHGDLEAIARLVRETWAGRADRGAEERLAEHARSALAHPEELRRDPRLEMHTRGG